MVGIGYVICIYRGEYIYDIDVIIIIYTVKYFELINMFCDDLLIFLIKVIIHYYIFTK